MSLAEDMLANADYNSLVGYAGAGDAESHILIDRNRFITVPKCLKKIAVQGDHNIETVTFDCPRYWDNLDMSQMRIYINYMRPDGVKATALCENVAAESDDVMHFDWRISGNVTQCVGHIAFIVCVKAVDGNGNEKHHWNSEINKEMFVSEGLECDQVDFSEYPDIITTLLNSADTAVSAATSAQDAGRRAQDAANTSSAHALTSETASSSAMSSANTASDAANKAVEYEKKAQTAAKSAAQSAISAQNILESMPDDYMSAMQAIYDLDDEVGILLNDLITEHASETDHTQVSYEVKDEEYDIPTSDELDDLRETARINSVLNRDGRIYSVKIPKFSASQATTCEKMHDNVDLVCEPSTDTVEGRDDYANIPLFRWYNCNYKRLPDGHAYPTAIEGFDSEYTTDGDVDVGVIQMAPYVKWDDSNEEYVIFSISDTPHPGFTLWPEAQCGDKKYDYVVHSKYFSGAASDGMPRSQPNLAPLTHQSHNNIITNYAKKGSGYYGAGNARNSWQIVFTLIKYGAKSSQNIFAGCTDYSFQYAAAIERTDLDTFFPVTNAQANNIVIGNSVSVGYGRASSGAVNIDRYYDNMHAYARMAKVIRIEDIDENNKAVYLDVSEGFPTTTVDLDSTLSSPVYMSSMHCISGSTDAVIAHHDGSPVSNTNGKYAYRVQGIEYAVGGYFVASDTVLDFQSNTSKNVLVAPYGVKHSSSDSTIRSTYMNIGNIPASSDGKSGDYWIGDIKLDPSTGVFYPVSEGSGSTTGVGDMLYAGGSYTSGTREWLAGGLLGYGSLAGSSCLGCWVGLGNSYWYFLSAD